MRRDGRINQPRWSLGTPSRVGSVNRERPHSTKRSPLMPPRSPAVSTTSILILRQRPWSCGARGGCGSESGETGGDFLGRSQPTIRLRATGPTTRHPRFPRRIQPLAGMAFDHRCPAVEVWRPGQTRANGGCAPRGIGRSHEARRRPVPPGDDAGPLQAGQPHRSAVPRFARWHRRRSQSRAQPRLTRHTLSSAACGRR